MSEELDVAVVGMGPYGLAVAAALGTRNVAVFGTPLRTWRELMPSQMQLRAAWDDMSLTPRGSRGDLDDWLRSSGRPRVEPMRVDDFIAYCDWFRDRFVPREVHADVVGIDDAPDGLEVATADGRRFVTSQVVLAVGATPFARVPEPFGGLVGSGVELAATFDGYERLEGKRVVVVGAGQTAVEAAARALDGGAQVELLARSQLVWFADREPHVPRSPLRQRLYEFAYPAVGYGPPLLNRLVLYPDLFARLPAPLRRRLTARLLQPGGSPWLRERVEGRAQVSERVRTVTAERVDGQLVLALDDGSTRVVDLVLAAAGYRFELDRLAYLSGRIRERIAIDDSWPRLDSEFRTTHPRIAFVGYAAEGRFGASARFVLGARFAAPRVAAGIVHRV